MEATASEQGRLYQAGHAQIINQVIHAPAKKEQGAWGRLAVVAGLLLLFFTVSLPTSRGPSEAPHASGDAHRSYPDETDVKKEQPETPREDGDGTGGAGKTNPNRLGPDWDDRGVIQAQEFPSTSRFWMVDINKDRKAEFVAVDENQNFRFWRNRGPAGKDWVPFVEGKNSYRPAPGAVGSQLHFGDLDGDGFPDCMVVDLSGQMTVYTWKGDNPSGASMCMSRYDGFASVFSNDAAEDRPTIAPGTKIRFADITGEGRDDYLLTKPDGTTLAWYNKGFQGKGNDKYLDWDPRQTINVALESPWEIRYADINGDKRADQILITAGGGARAWINEGPVGMSGTYRDIGKIAGDTGVPPEDIQFADLDGDGKADFLRIGQTGVAHAWLNKLEPDYFDTFHP